MPTIHQDPSDETYLVDLQELDFFLWEQFAEHEALLRAGPHAGWDRARFERVLAQARGFARRLGDAYQASDREGCRLQADGTVQLPAAYGALWDEFRRNWVVGKPVEGEPASEDDPVRPILPPLLAQIVYEMFMGANPSFMTYGGFSRPASKILHRSGTPEQKAAFFHKLHVQEWDACFCSSETQAGSDVTALNTVGTPVEGDLYRIVGEKRFISAGMHQLTDNTLYFVLGRVESATPGSFSPSPASSCPSTGWRPTARARRTTCSACASKTRWASTVAPTRSCASATAAPPTATCWATAATWACCS